MSFLLLNKPTNKTIGNKSFPAQNVFHYALLFQQCENCHKPGATVSCCLTSCTNNYHFMCARQQQCAFLEDKKVYCQHHRDLIKGEVRNDTCMHR